MEEKTITKVAFWQLLGKFALQGIAFVTVPIMTRLLNTSEYGYSSLFNSWANFVTIFIGLNTYGSISNAIITYDRNELNCYLSSIFTISFISFFVITLLALLFKNVLSAIFGLSTDLCFILLLYCFSTYTVSFYVAKLDRLKKARSSAIISLSMNAITMIVAILCVLIFKDNKVVAKIYGQTFVHVLYGVIILVVIYINGKSFFNVQYWKFCIPLTLPLVFHSLGQLVFTQSDHIMIQKLMSDSNLGIYSIVCNLSGVLLIIYGALNTTWLPFYYDFKKTNNIQEILSHSKKYIQLFTVISAGFLCLAPEVFKLLAPQEYWSGLKLIPIFCCSYFFGFIYLFPVNFEFFYKKTFIIPLSTCIVAIVNVVLNFILIKIYGEIGAAFATFISYIIYFFLHFFAAKYLVHEDFEYKIMNFLPYILIVMFFSSLYYVFLDKFIIIRWIIAGVLAIYQIAIFVKNKAIF